MTLSPHIIVDNIPDDMLERSFLYLKRVKQLKFVNIGAGAQLDRGRNFVTRVHREIPHLRIVWRDLAPEDTGILARPDYSPEKLYAEKVKPNLKWFQDNKVIFMPDNETSGDDNRIRAYARDEAIIGHMLHADGLNGAFCRFATGNIVDGSQPGQTSQYPLLKPIYDMMNAGDIISPNEYRNRPGAPSGGHLYRYRKMWEAAGRALPTFIGEAGISVNYDPGLGYQVLNMSDATFCELMLGDEMWYENGAIDRAVYLIGGYTHESFRWRPGVFDYLENYYDKAPPVVVVPPPPPPLPAFPADFDARAQGGIAITGAAVNVRSQPSLSATIVGTLQPNTVNRFIPADKLLPTERIVSTIDGVTAAWIPISLSTPVNGKGWVWGGLVTWNAIPPFNQQVLTVLYNDLVSAANRTRQMSLELATISDDLVKDAELLDAMLKANKTVK